MRTTTVALLLALAAGPAAHAARERTGNLDAFVILDESGSMKPIFKRVTGYLGEALVRDYLVPGDSLRVIGFSDRPAVRISQRLSSEAEKANLVDIVRDLNVVPAGYTDMGRALEATRGLIASLADPSNQQVLLILTDGLNQPPRDSPYFAPARPDRGTGLAPPSSFNAAFLEQVKLMARLGHRVHVVGIGLETDARTLAEALGTSYTLLREFSPEELKTALARFWDETVNLVGVEVPAGPHTPGEEFTLRVKIRSTAEAPREIHLAGARLERLAPAATPPPVRLAADRWPAPPRQEAAYEARVALPADFPPGGYRAVMTFEQSSAVRFYPPQAEIAFHVSSFWERHGRAVVASSVGFVLLVAALLLHRRRPIPVRMVIEGDAGSASARPVRVAIAASFSIGGGATDRFRIPGLPQKVAVFERRSVHRFAIVSAKPELVPTQLEYALGEPVEVRDEGSGERRVVRFVRGGAARAAAPRTPPPRPRPAASEDAGVDFR